MCVYGGGECMGEGDNTTGVNDGLTKTFELERIKRKNEAFDCLATPLLLGTCTVSAVGPCSGRLLWDNGGAVGRSERPAVPPRTRRGPAPCPMLLKRTVNIKRRVVASADGRHGGAVRPTCVTCRARTKTKHAAPTGASDTRHTSNDTDGTWTPQSLRDVPSLKSVRGKASLAIALSKLGVWDSKPAPCGLRSGVGLRVKSASQRLAET